MKPACICCQCSIRVMGLIFGSLLLAKMQDLFDVTNENISILNAATSEDCSDEWSKIDVEEAKLQMEEAESKLISSSLWLYILGGWTIFEIALTLFLVGGDCYRSFKSNCRCSCRSTCQAFRQEFQYFIKFYLKFN